MIAEGDPNYYRLWSHATFTVLVGRTPCVMYHSIYDTAMLGAYFGLIVRLMIGYPDSGLQPEAKQIGTSLARCF